MVGTSVVCEFDWLIEETSLEVNLFLPSARPCVSPRIEESSKTSHNCMSIEKSENIGLSLAFSAPGSLE